MKKLLFVLCLCALVCIALATTALAAATDEFGEATIVEGMTTTLTDTTSRMVLKNGDGTYTTYPTCYMFNSLNWRKGMTGASFDKLNALLGTSYTIASVIRIEVLLDCEYMEFDTGIYENLIEIHFPKESKITQIRRYYSNVGVLQKINIPASVTGLDQNAFRDCSGLKEITFDEGCSLTTIAAEAFKGCSSLESIFLPDSITSIGSQAFAYCTSLKEVHLGKNTDVIGSIVFGGMPELTGIKLYASGKFMSSYTGDIGSGYFGYNYVPTVATVYFTGTRAEAEALVAKSTHVDKWNGTGGLKNAVLVEYDPTKSDDYYVSDTLWTIVYGYNTCLAFYGSHAEGAVLNSCQFGCGRGCGKVELLDNPQHSLAMNTTFGENGYLGQATVTEQCSVCQTKTVEASVDALFESMGYSVKSFGGSMGLVQGYKLNKDAIVTYKSYITSFNFGILACSNASRNEFSPLPTDAGVIDVKFDTMANDYIEISLVGIPASHAETAFIFCLFITEGDRIYYIDNGETKTSLTGVSYAALS